MIGTFNLQQKKKEKKTTLIQIGTWKELKEPRKNGSIVPYTYYSFNTAHREMDNGPLMDTKLDL